MRYPIYSSNPANSLPILRKSLAYIRELLANRSAHWIDEDRPELGVRVLSKFALQKDGTLHMVAGSGFDTAWHIKQSGYDGPLVWQLKTHGQLLTDCG